MVPPPAPELPPALDEATRLRVEAALRESEERYRATFEAAPIGICEVDLEGRYLRANPAFYEIRGMTPEELIGTSFAEVTHPEDLDDELRQWEQLKRGEIPRYMVEKRFRRPDGTYRWVTLTCSVVRDDERRPLYAIRVTEDITDKRVAAERIRHHETALAQLNETLERQIEERASQLAASRARLRAFFDNSPDWLTLQRVTPEGRFVYEDLNPTCEASYGLSRDQVIGQTVEEVLGKEAAQVPLHHFRECLRTGQPQRYATRRTMGGVTRFIDVMFALVPGDFGGDRFIITAARDITDREELAEQLRQAQKMEAVGQLTGGVAHDFNNLLTAILGNLELLGMQLGEEKQQRLIEAAARSARRGARLTEQLLAFSRKQHLTPTPIDLNRSISGMNDMLARTIRVSIDIRTILAPDLWPALVDPNQIELVLLNLAINARDAMSIGGALVIETHNVPAAALDPALKLAPGDYIVAAVTDTGAGMSAEVLEKAFEPFFTTKEPGKGSGLGLSQVYGVARQSGGSVRIRSRLGEGTTVEVYLPRALAAAEPPRDDARLAPAARRRARILVVDDQPEVREVAVAHLEVLGYDAVEAPNGRIALDLLAGGERVDLVIVDYVMPGQSGVEVMRVIAERYPGLPVLLLTGYADSGALDRQVDAALMLRKPYRMQDLAARVELALSRRAEPAETHSSNVVALKPRAS